MWVLKIILEKLLEKKDGYTISGKVETMPQLVDIGCFGIISVTLSLIPCGSQYWINGYAEGGYKYECSCCGSPLNGKFKIPIKILMTNTNGDEIIWDEEKSDNFDEYVVSVGNKVRYIPLMSVIKEQVVLNCNKNFPPEEALVDKCKECGGVKPPLSAAQNEQKIDPRWEILSTLKKSG